MFQAFSVPFLKTFRKLKRSQYKQVWNAVSKSQNDAKMAVAGTADEAELEESTDFTWDILQRCVGLRTDDVILEIGAGVGRNGALLAPLCKEWIGVDASENMVRHTKKRLSHLSNVRVLATNGYDLAPIASGSIDLVYCTVVLMHLSQWERYGYVKEAFRVLKPGGRILIDSVNIASDEGWELFETHLAIAPDERPPNISEMSTSIELVTYLARAGFADIRHELITMWIVAYGRKPLGVATMPA